MENHTKYATLAVVNTARSLEDGRKPLPRTCKVVAEDGSGMLRVVQWNHYAYLLQVETGKDWWETPSVWPTEEEAIKAMREHPDYEINPYLGGPTPLLDTSMADRLPGVLVYSLDGNNRLRYVYPDDTLLEFYTQEEGWCIEESLTDYDAFNAFYAWVDEMRGEDMAVNPDRFIVCGVDQ